MSLPKATVTLLSIGVAMCGIGIAMLAFMVGRVKIDDLARMESMVTRAGLQDA